MTVIEHTIIFYIQIYDNSISLNIVKNEPDNTINKIAELNSFLLLKQKSSYFCMYISTVS